MTQKKPASIDIKQVLKTADIILLAAIALGAGYIMGLYAFRDFSIPFLVVFLAAALGLICAFIQKQGILFALESLFCELTAIAAIQMNTFYEIYGEQIIRNVIIMAVVNIVIVIIVYFLFYKLLKWKTLLIANLIPVLVLIITCSYMIPWIRAF